MEFDPVSFSGWQSDDVRAALEAIKGRHEGKMRATAIRVGFAMADFGIDPESSLKQVFKFRDICSRNIWYGQHRSNGKVKRGWRDIPEIAAAVEAIKRRALEMGDAETIQIVARFRNERRKKIAVHAADMPDVLAGIAKDEEQPAQHRIKAANDVMSWADPEAAEKVKPHQQDGADQSVNVIVMDK